MAPKGFVAPGEEKRHVPWQLEMEGLEESRQPLPTIVRVTEAFPERPPLRLQYKQIFNRLKMTVVDLSTRRDVLR